MGRRNPPAGLVSCYGDHTASTCWPVLVHNQKKKPTLCAVRSSHSNLEMLWHSCNWMPQFFFFLSSTKRINNLENDTLFFMEVTLFVIWQSWRIITTTLGAAVFTNRGDQQTVLGSDHFHWFTDNEQAGKRNKQLLSSSLDGNLCREGEESRYFTSSVSGTREEQQHRPWEMPLSPFVSLWIKWWKLAR